MQQTCYESISNMVKGDSEKLTIYKRLEALQKALNTPNLTIAKVESSSSTFFASSIQSANIHYAKLNAKGIILRVSLF